MRRAAAPPSGVATGRTNDAMAHWKRCRCRLEGKLMGATWSTEELPDGGYLVSVRGEVDLAEEQPLVDAVDAVVAKGASRVDLDLQGVTFLDSSGVRALLRMRGAYGDRVVIGPLSNAVLHVLNVAGVREHLSGGQLEGLSGEHDST